VTWALIVAGLVLLAGGGELLVRGAVGVARTFRISPLLVGLVLVGFGTSTPELLTSLIAAFQGAPGIAVGNVVGSNTANILLILGATAVIYPLAIQPGALRRDGLVLIGSTVACMAAVLIGRLNLWVGSALLALLAVYLVWAYLNERAHPDAQAETHEHMAADAPPGPRSMLVALAVAVIGIGLTVLGARLLVSGAIDLARGFGISETVIGLTVVAIGTSLPELVACVIAALRRHADVALGNVIGSNIFNVLGVLGVTAVVRPITVPAELARFDIWVLAAATALLMVFLRTGWTLSRWEGGVFLVGYLAYIGFLLGTV